jgi:hypothetical protein
VIATVKEDENGELYIELSDELMEQMGWGIGTELVWAVEDDKITLREETEDVKEYMERVFS